MQLSTIGQILLSVVIKKFRKQLFKQRNTNRGLSNQGTTAADSCLFVFHQYPCLGLALILCKFHLFICKPHTSFSFGYRAFYQLIYRCVASLGLLTSLMSLMFYVPHSLQKPLYSQSEVSSFN